MNFKKIFFLLGTLFWVSCSSVEPGAPLIQHFQFEGQDTQRKDLFYFQVEWQDKEGDLTSLEKGAELLFVIQDLTTQKTLDVSVPVTKELVPPGTLSGKLEKISLQIQSEDPNYPPKLRISVQLKDSQSHQSNIAWVLLEKQ